MKKLFLLILVLFSGLSYSQILKKDISTINGKVSSGLVFYDDMIISILMNDDVIRYDNVVPGDEMDDFYTIYSDGDEYKFDFYCDRLLLSVRINGNSVIDSLDRKIIEDKRLLLEKIGTSDYSIIEKRLFDNREKYSKLIEEFNYRLRYTIIFKD